MQNTHIHAFSFSNTWKLIGKNIIEGAVYIIETFMVRDASGNLKPVSTDTSIRFTNATTFQPCTDYVMIPKYKFEFMDLGDLMDEARKYGPKENPEFSIGYFLFPIWLNIIRMNNCYKCFDCNPCVYIL